MNGATDKSPGRVCLLDDAVLIRSADASPGNEQSAGAAMEKLVSTGTTSFSTAGVENRFEVDK